MRYALLAAVLLLAGCEGMGHADTARALLQKACARPDLWDNVPPNAQQAMQQVCARVNGVGG